MTGTVQARKPGSRRGAARSASFCAEKNISIIRIPGPQGRGSFCASEREHSGAPPGRAPAGPEILLRWNEKDRPPVRGSCRGGTKKTVPLFRGADREEKDRFGQKHEHYETINKLLFTFKAKISDFQLTSFGSSTMIGLLFPQGKGMEGGREA